MAQVGFGFTSSTKIESLTRSDLIKKYQIMSDELKRVIKENYAFRAQEISENQLKLILEEQLGELQNTLFGSSSERYKKPEEKKKKSDDPAKPKIKKPSERYPNIPVRENLIKLDSAPSCSACGEIMTDSGMTEDSEQLTVIPKKYEILLNKRVKYRCSCHGCIQTAPSPGRIIPGSAYSDEMIQDVVISKYCDLIPIERYAAMAGRGGLINLPPQSLISLTHAFADFVRPVYQLIKDGVLSSRVVCADETPHRMLEGSLKKSWYLWGFSTSDLCYLDCQDTRSGKVASQILADSACEVLVTDVFSGYAKAIKDCNAQRGEKNKVLISGANCNGHARRYFFKPRLHYKEAEYFLDCYHEIYRLNAEAKGKSAEEVLRIRTEMRPHFELMKEKAMQEVVKYPRGNKYGKALNYFLGNYQQLILFLNQADVPIDNNGQERLFRNYVVGRKTWYGTHSERGAETAAILFSIIETCKMNQVNPREYFKSLVKDLLEGKNPYTPTEFRACLELEK